MYLCNIACFALKLYQIEMRIKKCNKNMLSITQIHLFSYFYIFRETFIDNQK